MINDDLSRRDFIKRSGVAGAGAYALYALPLKFLQAQTDRKSTRLNSSHER